MTLKGGFPRTLSRSATSAGPSARRAALPECSGRTNCRVYTVVPGDYLLGLARYFGVDYNALLAYNPQLQARPNLIYSDEKVYIPD